MEHYVLFSLFISSSLQPVIGGVFPESGRKQGSTTHPRWIIWTRLSCLVPTEGADGRAGLTLSGVTALGRPPPGWPLTSCDPFSVVLVQHQSMFEWLTLECPASHNNLQQHCLELNEGEQQVFVEPTLWSKAWEMIIALLSIGRFKNSTWVFRGAGKSCLSLTQTSRHTIKQKPSITALILISSQQERNKESKLRVQCWYFSIPTHHSQVFPSHAHIFCRLNRLQKHLVWILLHWKKRPTLPTIWATLPLQNTGTAQMAISQLYNCCVCENKVPFCNIKSSRTQVIFKDGELIMLLTKQTLWKWMSKE